MAARPIFEARLLGTPAKEVGGISGAEGAASVGLGGVVWMWAPTGAPTGETRTIASGDRAVCDGVEGVLDGELLVLALKWGWSSRGESSRGEETAVEFSGEPEEPELMISSSESSFSILTGVLIGNSCAP